MRSYLITSSVLGLLLFACGGDMSGDPTPQAGGDGGAVHFADTGPTVAAGDCNAGETRACDSGLSGACAAGQQSCVLQNDVPVWGPCNPTLYPGSKAEDCSGSVDLDCDGKLPVDDEDCAQPVDSCQNGVKDAGEIDVDCGGVCSAKCKDGSTCTANADCANNSCYQGRCAPPPCQNGVKDAGETDVDCGGSCDALCDQGEGCAANEDCSTGRCLDGRCVVCNLNAPSISGEGCDRMGTTRMQGLTLDGNTLQLKCVKSELFSDNETTYSTAITLSGASFGGSGCDTYERFESMDIDTAKKTLRVTCVKTFFDNETISTRTITLTNAQLAGGCNWDEKAVRLWRVDETRLGLLCEEKMVWSDNMPGTTTRYLDIKPVTICK